VHLFVRKAAHLTEYTILAVLLCRALRGWIEEFWRRVALILAPAMIFAATDEFHQSFVRSRTPSVRDVLPDGAGALLGVLRAPRVASIKN
jgi:VanZ family protein